MKTKLNSIILLFFFIIFLPVKVESSIKKENLEVGQKLFLENCNVCHKNRENIILPEKKLTKEVLEANGMNTLEAISYQIVNGKNGMPAFGGRLSEDEIFSIAQYILQQKLD